jgi:hypothetical protein
MLTYVTAFYLIRTDVVLDEYIQEFHKLVSTGVPILLFLDPAVQLEISAPNVTIAYLPFELIDNAVLPRHRNESKDTLEFLSLMLMKMKCMSEALKYTPSSHLAWVDFRVFHVVRDTREVQKRLRSLTRVSFPGLKTILAPGCWAPTPNFDILNSICWRFCGGFFLGPREIFPLAYQQQTNLVQHYLPHLTWEVNYWTKMEELFTWFPGDHNDSIIPCIETLRTTGVEVEQIS